MPGAEELAALSLPPMTRERVAELFDVPEELLRTVDGLMAERRREVEAMTWWSTSMTIPIPYVSDELEELITGQPAVPHGFPAAGPRDARNQRR